jgi:endonuclease/exonuclease/phosphatase family metal-dependent hydrolase
VVKRFLLPPLPTAQGVCANPFKILFPSTRNRLLSPAETPYPPSIHKNVHKLGWRARTDEPGRGNASADGAAGYARTIDALTVASFNLHGGSDTQGKPYEVPAAVGGLNAAIICLQEDRTPAGWAVRAGRDLVAATGRALGVGVHRAELGVPQDRSHVGVFADRGSGRLCISILTALPVISYEVVALGHGPGDSIPRVAQVVILRSPAGGLLRLVNCHLTFSVSSPLQLRTLWRSLRSDAVPTVIAGDLNMPGLIARRFPGLTELVRGATFPAHQPVVQLDHVLVTSSIQAGPGTVLPAAGSDHRPVHAQLLGISSW